MQNYETDPRITGKELVNARRVNIMQGSQQIPQRVGLPAPCGFGVETVTEAFEVHIVKALDCPLCQIVPNPLWKCFHDATNSEERFGRFWDVLDVDFEAFF